MFKERLKKLRGSMSQQDLAKTLKVSRGAVGMWESTDRIPNYKILIKIANYFNVTTDYLLGNDNVNNVIVIPDNKKELVEFVVENNITNELFELFKMTTQLNNVNLMQAICHTAGLLTAQN